MISMTTFRHRDIRPKAPPFAPIADGISLFCRGRDASGAWAAGKIYFSRAADDSLPFHFYIIRGLLDDVSLLFSGEMTPV